MTDKIQWINWDGGSCPVQIFAIVQVQYRDGRVKELIARQPHWFHDGRDNNNDIVKYRVIGRIPRQPTYRIQRVMQ